MEQQQTVEVEEVKIQILQLMAEYTQQGLNSVLHQLVGIIFHQQVVLLLKLLQLLLITVILTEKLFITVGKETEQSDKAIMVMEIVSVVGSLVIS